MPNSTQVSLGKTALLYSNTVGRSNGPPMCEGGLVHCEQPYL